MKKTHTTALTARLFLVGLLACVLTGANDASRNVYSSQLSRFMDSMVEQYGFSGAVLVKKQSKTEFTKGFGLANIELEIPNSPTTKFRIGSVTKQFTAMAVLILAENGQLALHDPISQYVPNSPDNWERIQIHHLLNHTSGIMHSWNLPEFRDNFFRPFTLEEVVNLFKKQPLLFEPGSDYEYSGVGYFILAQIIEQVTNMSYATFLKAEIFDPLDMHDTGPDSYIPILPNRADGYTRVNGKLQNAPHIYMPNLTGGGNLYSTVEDLAKWDGALYSHMFISDQMYAEMFTPGKEDYGYGWRIYHKQNYDVIEHTGSVNGFHAYIRRIPQKQVSIIVLTNESTSESWKMVMDGLQGIAIQEK